MERLHALIADPRSLTEADKPLLAELVQQYPWFVQAKLLLLRLATDTGDTQTAERMRNALALRLAAYPTPAILLKTPDLAPLQRRNTMDIIGEFLAVEDKRIVPDEEHYPAENDIAAESNSDSDSEMVSEALAEVYARQGLYDEAIRIYRRLSLKFPEKSVYFADIIEQISKKE